MAKSPRRKLPVLDQRTFALLFAVKHGAFPDMLGDPEDEEFIGVMEAASQVAADKWVMSDEFTYTQAEISAMEAAGWITTDGPPCSAGFKTTRAGPKLDAALAMYLH